VPTRPLRIARLLAAAATVAAASPVHAGAQQIDTVYKGQVLGRLVTRGDSTFSYAAYIPRRYTPEHPAPLLLVLDPRGRADLAIQLMVPAAERLGWLVMSSYDTRGDDPKAPNEKAVNLMLRDALGAFKVDTSRLYLAGFSGTARDTWVFAYGAGGHVAGIISAGATLPGDSAWRRRYGGKPPFDVALTAGDSSFDDDEMLATLDSMRRLGAPMRAEEFAGDHRWPPVAVMSQAMGWLEARAMARGLRPMQRALGDSVFAIDSARAAALEAAGRPGPASDVWEEIATAWRGAHAVDYADARVAALSATARVNAWRAERDSLLRLTVPMEHAMGAQLSALRRRPGVPDLRKLNDDLRIAQYRQWSTDHTDSVRAAWAVRRLADLFVQVSYYEPEAYLAVGDDSRALGLLAIADEIHTRAPGVCRERARAYALRRDTEATLSELRCALAGGATTVDEIKSDRRYLFMRASDDFLDLISPPGR
jgi:predicted esterase